MIVYREPLYLTSKTANRLRRIKVRLKLGAGMTGVSLITLSENKDDLFDIIPAALFKQRYLRKRDHEYVVIGIAENKRAAYKLVKLIINDVYNKTGSYKNIKSSFLNDSE